MAKKGEITTTQIALVVLAIIGFVIVLYFLFSIDIEGLTKDDTCRLSVLVRATLPSAAQSVIPLKCTTKKICITNSLVGGGCREQFAGEEDIEIVRLTGKSVGEKRRMIEEISANAMYDCWNVMGQGKLDIFGNFYKDFWGTEPAQSTCVICSRIAIDKSVDDTILYEKETINGKDVISGVNVNTYMVNNKVLGKDITYLQAFTDKDISAYSKVAGGFEGEAYKKLALENLRQEINGKNAAVKDVIKQIEADIKITGTDVNRQIAFVFMQIKAKDIPQTNKILKNIGLAGATAAGATFMTPLVGGFGSALYVGLGTMVAASGSEIYGAWNKYEGQINAAGYCGGFSSTKEGAQQGCSVIEAMNYKYQLINQICKRLQGSS